MFRVEGIDIWNFYGRTSSKVGYAACTAMSLLCFAKPGSPNRWCSRFTTPGSLTTREPYQQNVMRYVMRDSGWWDGKLSGRVGVLPDGAVANGSTHLHICTSALLTSVALRSLFRQLGNRGGAEMRQLGFVLRGHVGIGVARKFRLSFEKAFQRAQGLMKSGWRQRAHRYTSCSSQDITAIRSRLNSRVEVPRAAPCAEWIPRALAIAP